jgi:signal transduction histidine kinase
VLLSGAAGLILFRHLLRRLRVIEEQAVRVTEGHLDARIQDTTSDEIGRLGSALNTMTERLQSARGHLEATDTARRRLLADISHELGTPLTSIRGHAETLLDAEVPLSDDERRAYLDTILHEARRMDLLIQDLFELTRLEAGASELNRERLDWAALGRNTAERFRPRYTQAGLTLTWRGGDEPVWIHADGRRMEQVLDNLLINALRYVPAGGSVTLDLATGEGVARFGVEDDGPGIPPEALPHVFERFYRADPSRTGLGSGLGLAIVREIVENHGGSVRAAPRPPSGLRFEIVLPAVA